MLRNAAAFCVVLLVLAIPHAAAHANYFSSEPARGARLAAAPLVVSVRLSEPVDPAGSSLAVRDQTGARVDTGPMRFQGGNTPVLTVDLQPGLGPGAYQATWKALSTVDGHVTDGTFGFAVGGFEPPADQDAGVDLDPLSAVSRTVNYLGFALAIGVVVFAAYVEPGPVPAARRRILGRVLVVGAALLFAGVAGLFLHTVAEAGRGVGAFLATSVGTEFGWRLAAAAATLLVGLLGLRDRLPLRPMAVLLALDALGNSIFVHSANEGWWASLLDAVHLVSVSAWLGGLGLFLHFILATSRTGTYDDVVAVGARFSRVALAAVALLGLTGLASSVLILGPDAWREPLRVWTSPYGAILAAKVLLFAAMIGLAGVNRLVFLGKRPGPDEPSPLPLRIFDAIFPTLKNRGQAFARGVGMEASLGVVVLVAAGFLTAISPPAAPAEAYDGFRALGLGDHHNVTLFLQPPPREGQTTNVTFDVETSADGKPLTEAVRIRVTVAPRDGNATGGETYSATHLENGRWTVGNVLLARDGPHEVRFEVQTQSVYSDIVRVPFEVAPGP